MSLTILGAAALVRWEADRLLVRDHAPFAGGQVFELTASLSSPAARAERYAALLRRLQREREFDSVSLTSAGALTGLGMIDVATTDCGRCTQGGIAMPLRPVRTTHYLVSADTFHLLGLSVNAGRSLTDDDGWNAPRVAVVSRSLATHYYEGGRAVGRGILIGLKWYKVVGVVDDQRPLAFGTGLQPPYAAYLSVLQHPARAVDLVVRASKHLGLIPAIRRQLGAVLGPTTPVAQKSVDKMLAAEAAPYRWFGSMFNAEGWITLALATIGTFVVMRLWVMSLFYELGLRRAVGARRRDLVIFIAVRAMGVAIGGVALGIWAGFILWEPLADTLGGLRAWDPEAALGYAPLLVGATLAGALTPTWRAARARLQTMLVTARS